MTPLPSRTFGIEGCSLAEAHPRRSKANTVATSAPPFITTRRLIAPVFVSLLIFMFCLPPSRLSQYAKNSLISLTKSIASCRCHKGVAAGNGAAPECTRPSNFHPKSIRSRNSQTCIFIANTALSVPPASEPTLTNSNVIITATNVVTFLLFWVPNTKDQAELAQELDVISVAEGVETREQLDFLRSKSCDIAQGYFFSRPIPKQEFLTWLEAYQANAKSSYSGRF